MITLITGIPGMGKTALLVSMLMEFEEKAERPIFVMGINDLQIEHVKCPPVAQWTEKRPDPEDPTLMLDYFTFPANSILVIDEAQRVYRPRSSASKIPPEEAAMETHRHGGIDIILLTQKPKLIASNVRELVGRHIHIRNGLMGRYLFEWPHIADGESRLDRSDAAKRRFKPPKAAFTKYKSAELHTKQTFRLNQIWIYLSLALAFFSYTTYAAIGVFDKNVNPKEKKPIPISQQSPQTNPRSGAGQVAATPPVEHLYVNPTNAKSHPFEGWTFYIRGLLNSARGPRYYFDLVSQDGNVTPSDSRALAEAGYIVEALGPCAAMIRHHNVAFTAVCKIPRPQLEMSPLVPGENKPVLNAVTSPA